MRAARESIALVGFMGTGKSTIGRLIATRLHHRLVDTDQLVIARAGIEIAEIFSRDGEAHFRALEADVLRGLDAAGPMIIATGGGLVTNPQSVALLRERAFVVWLTASEEVIFERVSRNDKRPLMRTPDPRATIHDLLAEREPLYAAAADFTLDTSSCSHAEAADAIIAAAHAPS